ncbi:hypothetical protein ACFV6W_45780, partial [Streptomyces sp. NPDC059802]
ARSVPRVIVTDRLRSYGAAHREVMPPVEHRSPEPAPSTPDTPPGTHSLNNVTAPFRELIAGVEAALDLRAHRPGTLPRHTAYLHQRTAGRIGSPTRLIRQAAITSILDGSERITRTSLDQIRIDHLAETHHHTTMNGSRAPRR